MYIHAYWELWECLHLLYAYSLDTVVRFKNFEYDLYIQIRVTLLNKVDQFDGAFCLVLTLMVS